MLGSDHVLTKLNPNLQGIDPDETYNQCPYEKGFAFLRFLSQSVGKSKFDEFLRFYVNKYKFQSILPEDMFSSFFEFFPEHSGVRGSLDAWMNSTGAPVVTASFQPNPMQLQVDTALETWEKEISSCPSADKISEEKVKNLIQNWHALQTCRFLDKLLPASWLDKNGAQKLDEIYNFSESPNVEICLRWSKIAISRKIHQKYPAVKKLLSKTGKQKICLPLYRLFMKGDDYDKKFANEVFEETRANLFNVVEGYVKNILGC